MLVLCFMCACLYTLWNPQAMVHPWSPPPAPLMSWFMTVCTSCRPFLSLLDCRCSLCSEWHERASLVCVCADQPWGILNSVHSLELLEGSLHTAYVFWTCDTLVLHNAGTFFKTHTNVSVVLGFCFNFVTLLENYFNASFFPFFFFKWKWCIGEGYFVNFMTVIGSVCACIVNDFSVLPL